MNNLSTTEQILMTIFLSETTQKVKEQFISQKERVPVDAFNMSYRLFMATPNTINLELLVRGPLGLYNKPIGFYDKNLNIYVLHEFEEELQNLKKQNLIPQNLVVKTLSLAENAVIAAFSIEVVLDVLETFSDISKNGYESEFRNGVEITPNFRYDKKLITNGYNAELIMTFDGFPQFYLDDEYGLNGPIGVYKASDTGRLIINPIVEYKELFDKLFSLSLLTAYKKI